MPVITIKALKGRTVEQKKALFKEITESVIKHFKATPEQVRIIIIELKEENAFQMPVINIEAVEGRTIEQKRALVKAITESVAKHLKVGHDQVLIIIDELKMENAARKGKLFCD